MNVAPPIIRKRTIVGMSAVLLPFKADHSIDWTGFEAHLDRTIAAGIIPAVNMDTGFGPALATHDRQRVLDLTQARSVAFVAGAHVNDTAGDEFDLATYQREFTTIAASGGVPIAFPSFGLAALDDGALVDAYQSLGRDIDAFYGFELGTMFHPAGRIFSVEVFAALLEIRTLQGAKHSSLDRAQEWQRLAIRDSIRPDFLVLTGNDLAIDMVMYGSDYLLGLATFAPDVFARRDFAWAAGDDETFLKINDTLQYLGQFAFRTPVPGYRHNAAMFLKLRGHIDSDVTHPDSPQRPHTDRAVLAEIAYSIGSPQY